MDYWMVALSMDSPKADQSRAPSMVALRAPVMALKRWGLQREFGMVSWKVPLISFPRACSMAESSLALLRVDWKVRWKTRRIRLARRIQMSLSGSKWYLGMDHLHHPKCLR
jgi:hypothetical protein